MENESIDNRLRCLRCGNKWVAQVADPKYCPKCKSPYWNTEPGARRHSQQSAQKKFLYTFGVASKKLAIVISRSKADHINVDCCVGTYVKSIELSEDDFMDIINGTIVSDKIFQHPIGKFLNADHGDGNPTYGAIEVIDLFYNLGKAIQEQNPKGIGDIMQHLVVVKKYPTAMDVEFDNGTVFRLRKEDFKMPKNFQIWAMMNMHWITNFTELEWQQIVTQFASKNNSTTQHVDPLAPPVIDRLIGMIQESTPFNDFCPKVARLVIEGGSLGLFVLKDHKLYFTPSVLQQIKREQRITMREIRQILGQYLNGVNPEQIKIPVEGKPNKYKTYEFWSVNFPLLKEIRPTLGDIDTIKCEDVVE